MRFGVFVRGKIVQNDHGQIEQTVIQCYSVEDFTEALRLGFQRVMLPAWKYFYRNPIGPDVFDFYRRCIEINADAVWGLSLPYINKHMGGPIVDHPDFARMFAFWKRIFIHGAPPEDYPRILEMNAGLFADSINRKFEFKDLPKGFDWCRYLFLNRDLFKADRINEVEAMAHFLKFGRDEERLSDYDLPQGFTYANYINGSPKLRKSSINAFDSAAAHYTRHGVREGLKF